MPGAFDHLKPGVKFVNKKKEETNEDDVEIAEEYDDVPTFEEFKEITKHPMALDAVKELIDAYDKQGTLDFSGLTRDGYLKAARDPES